MTARRADERHPAAFSYIFFVYLLAATSETLISPLYPLIRRDLHLLVAQQASLTAVLTGCIAVCNILGGTFGHRWGDRGVIRLAAAGLAAGGFVSGTAHSYGDLLLGQVLVGVGSGLFWASGMATIGRIYVRRRSRAIAAYGLAYSVGLGLAAFAGDLGVHQWRWAFYATAAASLGLTVVAPGLRNAERSRDGALLASLRSSFGHALYRMLLVTAVVAGLTNYIILGFAPILFTQQGLRLSVIASFLGVGRVVSALGKYAGGWLIDRFGGPATGVWLMTSITVLGLPFFLLPPAWAAPVVIPLLVVCASLFTVSNILSVQALPSRASFSLGVYRSVLVCFSAVASLLVVLLLHVTSLRIVMLGMLVVPLVSGAVFAGAIRGPSPQ